MPLAEQLKDRVRKAINFALEVEREREKSGCRSAAGGPKFLYSLYKDAEDKERASNLGEH